jgi:hypothetical protein
MYFVFPPGDTSPIFFIFSFRRRLDLAPSFLWVRLSHLFGLAADLLLELCTVPPGQVSWRWLATMNTLTHILFKLMRKQVPPEKTKDVLDFATKKPHDRLQSIKNGLSVRFESYYTYRLLTFHQQVLAYGQSEYVRQFGMTVDHAAGPLKVQARVLKPPMLKYGPGSRQLTIVRVSYSCSSVAYKFILDPSRRRLEHGGQKVRPPLFGSTSANS